MQNQGPLISEQLNEVMAETLSVNLTQKKRKKSHVFFVFAESKALHSNERAFVDQYN